MEHKSAQLTVINTSTHCCFCSMQCGINLEPGGEPPGWAVKPSPDFPVATGRLCQKGFNSLEHVVHSSRITAPLQRTEDFAGGSEEDSVVETSAAAAQQPSVGAGWSEASWEQAYADIAARIASLQEQYGRDSVGVFGGGSLTNELCYLLGKFTRVALKSRYIDYNGRYCMSSAAAAQVCAFGVDRGLSVPLSDIPKAKYIILAGTNIAECQPTMLPYLMAAKKNGAVVVTIDPRNTMTSKLADIHVRLQPGFDSVLVNGLIHVMLKEKLYDAAFVEERTEGFDSLWEAVEPFNPSRVEEITGILEAVVRTIARGFAKADTGIVLTARGLEQQVNGVEHTLNYINLCLLTGKIGREGSGFGAVTGQANGQGGREHGQKADQLPGYRSIEDPEAREHVARIWGIKPDELPGKGVSAYELLLKIHAGEIKGLIVLGSNPLVSSPNSRMVEEALKRLELLVVIDMFVTETAEYAHWVLPGSSFLESEGTLTNLEGRVFYRPKAISTPDGNPHDFEIICEFAKRLGAGPYFDFASPEEIFNELRRASAGGKANYAGITYERLREEKGIFWPCPQETHPGTPLMFAERFEHPSGKARLHPITPHKPAEVTDREYPYILTTGRVGSHYLSGAQTRRTANLMKKTPAPVAEIHTSVARDIGLTPNDRIRITSRRGSLEFQVRVIDEIHPTTVFVPFHWGGHLSVNRLTNDALHPISRMPEFKIAAVKLEKV
jgi:assimilatory nitrate reductase catalytic subunit